MRNIRLYILTLLTIFCNVLAIAQEVIVNVTPVQNILPPQVMLYISDPGKYFNISLLNTTSETQNVYLALSLRQTMPASGLSVVTPDDCQPNNAFSIPAHGTRTLNMSEMKTLFNHVPSNRVRTSPGLFDDYMSGAFGLLPEGDYEAQITAYKWSNPRLQTPMLVSSPTAGKAYFTVCYKAQAPQFLMPMVIGAPNDESTPADLDALVPMFSWTTPTLTCNPAAAQYKYDFKVVEVLKNQSPVEAMERNPVVYQSRNLIIPQVIIPANIIKSQFNTTKTYAAQITATTRNANALNYIMIENSGKSTYKLFRIKTSDMDKEPEKVQEPEPAGDEEPQKKAGDDKEDEEDLGVVIGGMSLKSYIDPSADYTFSKPRITMPAFGSSDEVGARKSFLGGDISVEWTASDLIGGDGENPDTISIAYDVELFNGGNVYDMEAALATTPIYYNRLTECQDSISWSTIEGLVEKGNYLVLRINPIVTKGSSVSFAGDDSNIRDFAMAELLSKKYFQCSNLVDIDNTELTKRKASDFIGETVHIGEYELTISEMKDGKAKGTFEGKGHVLWQPLGFDVNVCVKFSDLKINTDNIVIEGTAQTYSNDEASSNIQVVDKLFSDWGIDNLIGDTGIPYANEIQGVARDKVKDIAKKIDLQKYYGYVKAGEAVYDAFLTGGIKDLYMPLSIPKSINKSPVDIQIVSMKFAATHATMDILGEFTLPNTNYTKNDILVLGAPRICISPNRILPESGTIALLSDFTINDPKSTFEMTFKAPENVLEPTNGCFVSWHDDAFERLGIDIDMKVPGLVKDINGTPSNENAVFNVNTAISDWNSWYASINIEPFQVSALPGYTFTASDVIYDHSLFENVSKMADFPKDYDKAKAGITGVVLGSDGMLYNAQGNASWQGLYIKEIGIKFPKALEFGSSSDKRLEVKATNMFFDKSGATLDVSAANIISAKTGNAGGWEFSLDKVYLSFLQSNFSNCGFSGKFGVPLLQGQMDYDCKILKLSSNAQSAGEYAYIFKVNSVKGIKLDFWLADADIKADRSYFLIESVPKNGKQDTSVELMLGGDVTIGGTSMRNKLKSQNKSLAMGFELPGVHFVGMRLSNKPSSSWKADYEKDMQKAARNASLQGTKIYTGQEMTLGSCYFNPGSWSVASDEKKLGGFDFSLKQYEFTKTNDQIDLYVQGKVGLVSGIDLSATASLTITAEATLPKSLSDIKNISLSYKATKFNDAEIDMSAAGVKLKGWLKVASDENKEGFEGTLSLQAPGELFTVDANGGYYKQFKLDYSYGWFYMSMKSSTGVPVPPITINGITGGFYYNCKQYNETSATPQKGLIGIIAGMKIATNAGEDAISADVDLTVVYDTKANRLSSMVLNGKVQALNQLVNANCNLVYQNDNRDRYLSIDITADASADCDALKKQLNSKFKGIDAKLTPKGSLASAFNDSKGKPEASKAPEDGDDLATVEIKAEVALKIKLTWKENGKTYSPVRWHVYVGTPELNDRCKITFLKFKSDIVSVDLGANAYLCLGNELPNGGQLPDIPSAISNYLNGGGDSKGIQGATLSQANAARKAALEEFNKRAASNSGGVMFGGQVYGYFDVNLGIFYLDAGATAGFDLSLVKFSEGCTNSNAIPGYKGWYGRGQLYAYLYAKFGIKINLGFWKKDFDFADARIGGLFQMQGPKPSHFEGKARVKLNLMSGLVNIDRSFTFECGDGCDLFAGNALDDFKLFGDLSIGYDNQQQGWNENNRIDPKLFAKPYFSTEAPLEEPFRVLDPNEHERLKKNFKDADPAALEMEANRTFIFRSNVGEYVTLYEYTNPNPRKNAPTYSFKIGAKNRFMNYIDMTQLNPNRYYRMTVTGYAKEIVNGKESDPLNWDEKKKAYVAKEWKQTKTYYFCTGPEKELPDAPDLQEYVAIAYPSYYNQLTSGSIVTAHENDVQFPNIAFTTDISKKCFKNGKLYWRIYPDSNRDYSKTEYDNDKLGQVSAVFTTTSKTCNLIASTSKGAGLKGYTLNKSCRLVLVYVVSSKDSKGNVSIENKILANLRVYPKNSHWKTGYTNDNKYYYNTTYEKPFIGSRINSISYLKGRKSLYDQELACGSATDDTNKRLWRIYDPYHYIGYLSNFAFFGGWSFASERLDADITTCQSVVYSDKGGVYEGKLANGKSESSNANEDYYKIRDLSVFSRAQWSKYCNYPLPDLNDNRYGYTLNGLSRVPAFRPSPNNAVNVMGYIEDMRAPITAANLFSLNIWRTMGKIITQGKSYFPNASSKNAIDKYTKTQLKNFFSYLKTWYSVRRGGYATTTYRSVTLQVPYYQFPMLLGSCLNNGKNSEVGTARQLEPLYCLSGYNTNGTDGFNHARCNEQVSEHIVYDIAGSDAQDLPFVESNKHAVTIFCDDDKASSHIKSAEFSIYRVNSYDFLNCQYTVLGTVNGETGIETFTINEPLKQINAK